MNTQAIKDFYPWENSKLSNNESQINPSQLNLFHQDKKNINVIVYCGYEGIEELVFASSNEDETVKKMMELKSKAIANKIEADKYTDEQKHEMLMSEDEAMIKKYGETFNLHDDPDRYCVMTFKDGKFACSCKDLGVSPEKPWLY